MSGFSHIDRVRSDAYKTRIANRTVGDIRYLDFHERVVPTLEGRDAVAGEIFARGVHAEAKKIAGVWSSSYTKLLRNACKSSKEFNAYVDIYNMPAGAQRARELSRLPKRLQNVEKDFSKIEEQKFFEHLGNYVLFAPHAHCFLPENMITLEDLSSTLSFLMNRNNYQVLESSKWIATPLVSLLESADVSVKMRGIANKTHPFFKIKYSVKRMSLESREYLGVEWGFLDNTSQMVHYHVRKPFTIGKIAPQFSLPSEVSLSQGAMQDQIIVETSRADKRWYWPHQLSRKLVLTRNWNSQPIFFGGSVLEDVVGMIGAEPKFQALAHSIVNAYKN